MRKSTYLPVISILVALSLFLNACGATSNVTPTTAAQPTAAPTVAAATDIPAAGEPVKIRWFVGLGTGTNPEQVDPEKAVVAEFNSTHKDIQIELEIVAVKTATDILSTEIASGNPPDIVGPVGVAGSNAFLGSYLDLAPYIKKTNYDLSQFDDEAVNFYNVEGQGQIGLPFGAYPSFIYYNRALFDEAGLAYPPHKVGEKYKMPDGTEKDWTVDTMTEVAMLLTLDKKGLNATEAGFDPKNVVQFGYQGQWLDLRGMSSLFGAGSFDDGTGKAQIPDQWRAAWEWYYDGIWTKHFIPNNAYSQSEYFGKANEFNSGHLAMGHTHLWYTCCVDGVKNWDIAVTPTYNGKTTSNLHVDTFRILKATKNPDQAFEVLIYLLGPASGKLLALYGSMPARKADQAAFFAELDKKYTQGVDWQVAIEMMKYPDIPSHEGYMPNYQKAYDRATALQTLMYSTEGLDIAAELTKLQSDLQAIFDEKK
jgi:multiple sugar transport system substrate-binding protein